MNFPVTRIPADQDPGWKIFLDGEERRVGLIELVSKYGRLSFGRRPEGYTAWAFAETGGGGPVTLPWTRTLAGEILVGLILEKRMNLGGDRLCAIGGFQKPGETQAAGQAREASEEAGLDTTRAVELPGLPTVSNRLFFVADPEAGEGTHAYALEVPFGWLVEAPDGYVLGPGRQDPNFKKPEALRFLPWREAVRQTCDSLARSAIAQLVATHL